jgi:hypothetical protein
MPAVHAQQTWESFQADEKRYMTEAKWERFPDGSRIFIGELMPIYARRLRMPRG